MWYKNLYAHAVEDYKSRIERLNVNNCHIPWIYIKSPTTRIKCWFIIYKFNQANANIYFMERVNGL
jgi:hypothetical protein